MDDAVSPMASGLCTAWGLCCSGPRYIVLRLGEDEVPLVEKLGIAYVDEGEGPALRFPCPKLVDKCCTGYEDRPTRCRDFRCETLRQLDEDEIAYDEA